MMITKNDDILTVKPITCIDCGKEIELPSHRIKTNNGYGWLCDECKPGTVISEGQKCKK